MVALRQQGEKPVEMTVFSAVPAESNAMPPLSPDCFDAILFGDDVKESKLLIVEINGRRTAGHSLYC
jgi:hypothetical protein